ncbi:hypothetical protein [Peribacillus deserti]|uniref:Uncharacterized protein n=1 Tax=Peribacillus deserti TaxID=673318 RepID=A0A2N5M617_9BACI|nr:hypothetical protein [Peribacillus deserti]PLT29800.1 hypothetical protein CUU66_10880 [Peribacillus deserti]
MSFFQKLFNKKKMDNQELLEKMKLVCKDYHIHPIILREVIPFFEEKSAKLGQREFHPWIEDWSYSPDFLVWVHTHFTKDDLFELSKQGDVAYDFYVNEIIDESQIHEEKYPIEVDQYEPDIKTAFFVTALRIRDIIGSALPY